MMPAIPASVSAGLFTFLSDFFNPKPAVLADSKLTANVQNMALLRAAVNFDPNPSKGGGDIVIVDDNSLLPESGPSGTIANINEESEFSEQISIYVVREGDSLSQIAEMFNVSVNTIKWANDITHASRIKVGETLVILPISGIQHTVAKGDTIQGIAKKYKADVDEILNYNEITLSHKLAIGDVVVVPDGEIAQTSAGSVVRGSSGPSYAGYYIRPVSGGRKTQGLHGYNGVDLAAPTGTPVVASASGDVIISKNFGWNGGYGNYIVIKHSNGTQTLYSHLDSNIVYPGQNVVQGQVIGYIGSTGRSTGPHLHFEIRGAKNPF